MKKILALLLFLAFAGSAHTQTYWPPEGSGGEGVDVCVGQTQDVGDVFTSSGGADSCYNLQAPPGAGGGEANTASNLGGGVGITNTKVGIDLPFDTFSSNQFSAASNVISLNIVADYVGTGSWDLGGGSFEIPNGASLPGTCNIGQMYHWTGTTSGQRTFVCESANTWVLQGDGGAGGGGTPDDDSVTPAKMADGDFGDWSVATNIATLDADTVGLAELAACTGPNEIVEYGASGVPACIATPGGGGGSQTPWASNIDGAGFDLTGVGALSVQGLISRSGSAISAGTVVAQFTNENDRGYVVKISDSTASSMEIGRTTDGGSTFVRSIFFDNTGVRTTFGAEFVVRANNGGLSVQQDGHLGFSNSDADATAFEAGFFYDGTDTVNLGTAQGTADADLQVDEIQLTDQGTKGTCDSAKAGTIAYEVVTNVGTFHGCQQTGVGTFAWVALH